MVRDGIATGEAEAAHSARKVPQEHTSQAPASAGTDSGWTMPTTASGRSALRRRAKTCSTTMLFVSSVTRKRYHLVVKIYCTSPLLCNFDGAPRLRNHNSDMGVKCRCESEARDLARGMLTPPIQKKNASCWAPGKRAFTGRKHHATSCHITNCYPIVSHERARW